MAFTYDDLLQMPDDGRHYEILDAHVEANRLGVVYTSPIDVVFTQQWVVEPDVLYICNARKSIVGKTNVVGAPDLAVEVLSDSTRKKDEVIKRRAYEDFGVGEYWIVDPLLESIKIYRRNASGKYERVEDISTETEGATINSPLFPELQISLARVFAE